MIRTIVLFAGIWGQLALAADQSLPSEGTNTHVGVASCASSTCHGSVQPFRDSSVMQNEFSIWQNEDPHNGAYRILESEESARIAGKLGLGDATSAEICLDCHADNVPASSRGERFQISDGVGCEACHGGAESWLSSHASGTATHEENLQLGMYPTEDPIARANLCLSCHLGNKNQMITHRIMGAGHPRLQFELDNFTWMHAHFEVDDDYVARKGNIDGARDWAVGQGVAARTQLQTLLDEQAGWNGIFPELVLFDCHACHRLMSGDQWVPRNTADVGPGVVRYNDANLLMYRHVVSHLDPALAGQLEQQTRDLHRAMRKGRAETEQAARALLSSLDRTLPQLREKSFDSSALKAIFASLLRDADRGDFRDYAAAEQAALAVDTVLIAFETTGALSSEEAEALQNRAGALYDATREEDSYRQSEFVAALKALQGSLP